MARKLGVRTVTVVRPVKTDRLSDPPAGAPPQHPIEGCAVLPRTSFERERGWVVVEGYQVIAPYGSDVLASDQVRLEPGGPLWAVEGRPGDFESRRGVGKATIFYLKRAGS